MGIFMIKWIPPPPPPLVFVESNIAPYEIGESDFLCRLYVPSTQKCKNSCELPNMLTYLLEIFLGNYPIVNDYCTFDKLTWNIGYYVHICKSQRIDVK